MSSSGITLSGFNGIDFSVVVNAVMAQASQPLTRLQTQQSAIKSQVSTFGTLSSKLSALGDAAAALAGGSALTSYSTSVSDSSIISAASGSSATPGHYDVTVNELARAQVTASASTSPDATTTSVASGGWLTINGKQIDVQAPITLNELAKQINQTSGVGAQASVVQTGSGAFRLVLTGNATGSSNSFTIQNHLTGGSGVSFTDTNGDGTSGDSSQDNAVQATDAQLTVNSIPITSQSNTVDTAIPGTTLTLAKKAPGTTVGIDIKADSSTLKTKLQTFVNTYNSLQQFASDQSTSAANGSTSSIARDSMFRSLRNQLRDTLTSTFGSDATQTLSQLGVEFTQTGTLQLNATQFETATANGTSALSGLLGTTDSPNGAFDAINALIKQYTQSSGIISQTQSRLNDQISNMGSEIASMQSRLDIQRTALMKEYSAADAAMTQLKSQSGSLSSLTSLIGSSSSSSSSSS